LNQGMRNKLCMATATNTILRAACCMRNISSACDHQNGHVFPKCQRFHKFCSKVQKCFHLQPSPLAVLQHD
jgi:hypothetical protein